MGFISCDAYRAHFFLLLLAKGPVLCQLTKGLLFLGESWLILALSVVIPLHNQCEY